MGHNGLRAFDTEHDCNTFCSKLNLSVLPKIEDVEEDDEDDEEAEDEEEAEDSGASSASD